MAGEPHILRGARSSSDAQPWTCTQCYMVNQPKEHLLFDLPSFTCNGFVTSEEDDEIRVPCEAKHLDDFSISLADIQVNDSLLLGDVFDIKRQFPAECIANAIATCMEITERVKRLLKGRDPKRIAVADAHTLHWRCKDNAARQDVRFGDYGLQDMVAMALLATTEGVHHAYGGGYYRMSSAAVIEKYDFQKICEALADGYPLVCSFLCGKKLENLKYCQLYTPPSAAKFRSQNKPIIGHAAVIVGAGRHMLREYIYFLNSWGVVFCRRVDENGQLKKAGVGKIRVCDLMYNNIIFPRNNEIVGQTNLMAQDTNQLSQANRTAMIPSTQGWVNDVKLGYSFKLHDDATNSDYRRHDGHLTPSGSGGRGDRFGGSDRDGGRTGGSCYGDDPRGDRCYGRGGPRVRNGDIYGSGGPARFGGSYRGRPAPYNRPSRGSYENRY